jgi:ArsR family transcriptional regulator
MATTAAPVRRESDLRSASQIFHALSDETRLEIVGMLRDGERCVCDLMSALDAAQSRLSFHLKVLKDAGIVIDRRHGRWVYYSLSKEALDDATGFIKSLKGHRRLAVINDDCCR